MTEGDAKQWIADRFGAAALGKLTALSALVADEASRQNLVSAATLESMWNRHILDSAQLVPLAKGTPGTWVDIGSGAGFPGLVVAALRSDPMILIEPRKRRVEFLRAAASALDLDHVTVKLAKSQNVEARATVISARAVASVTALFEAARHIGTPATKWLLPKGLAAREEVAQAQRSWHGTFHVEHSVTDPNSMIVIAQGVSRR
ncbi:16S rRNA (guanine(527)-N(7))-methyltransferase RsmG [Sphingomonas hylomeconis]|uniref:Ribosomal RNA small subunit methyltransferase G n=1 Tax=Sphingomonas hylomeconis TaxID=1395958 RepID=A0ABV7SQD6_9SPHN|nr:16S rRNA (guanine(527)-N(7))-methyltransferase RsmG [Sphingomonas hylomeconis]